MIHAIKRNWILAAAVAGVTFISASASHAQYRVQTGNANDANNRLGSNGYNESGPGNGPGGRAGLGIYNGVTGNDIVTGDVTGGKQFRGRIDYTDPGAFREALAGKATDAFVRESSGAPYGSTGGLLSSNAQSVRPFFGDSRGVAPPEGTQQINIGVPGYVPSNAPDQRLGSDLRLGDISTLPTIVLPQPGETVLPGPVDASERNQTLIMASSLYGVRPFNSGNLSDQQFVQNYANTFGYSSPQNSLSAQELSADQSELMQATPALGQSTTITNPAAQQAQNQQNQALTAQTPGQQLPLSAGTLNNAPLAANQPQNAPVSAQPLGGGLGTGESVQSRVLIPAAMQSSANAALAQRLAQNGGANKPMTDVQAAEQYNRDMLAMKNAAAAKNNPSANQPANPNAPRPNPSSPSPTPSAPNGATPAPGVQSQKLPPAKIESLYAGVKAKGLGDLLKSGEDLMKQGKWYDAIQKYDLAQQVAPNNMLILIGRADAELGASSYGRADADIRTAFTQDPAMMEGQFDLRKMIGDDRLQYLVNDLKQIEQKNPTEAQPVFLLAYINYNIGNERMAAGYLDLAEKRAGGNDTFYSMVKSHWNLPTVNTGPATQPTLNK